MPEPLYNKAVLKDQLSFAVEMRSRTGFSGGMVVAYRTVATVLDTVPVDDFFTILGVNWGYIIDEEGENTWLNGVVPGWKIAEVFQTPRIKEIHAEATEALLTGLKNERGGAMPAMEMPKESVPAAKESALEADNPSHKGDFTRLLNAAAKARRAND
jgi:hypothetical protein